MTIHNDDNHTLDDLRPPFPIHNLIAYLPELELINLLDALDENAVLRIESALDQIESLFIALHRIDPSRESVFRDAIASIFDNSRDLAFDE